MIAAMLLAHLLADFVLQPDRLAKWKSRDLRGVAVHGLIVLGATAVCAWFVQPGWWAGILFISGAHFLIDALAWRYLPAPVTLPRFLIDQTLHLAIITAALAAGGFLADPAGTLTARQQDGLWLALGLVFLSMPAWVLLKFAGYAVVESSAPDFNDGSNKFVGIAERLLAIGLLCLGQVLLLPLVLLPRLLLARPALFGPTHRPVQAFELLGGLVLVALVGVGLWWGVIAA